MSMEDFSIVHFLLQASFASPLVIAQVMLACASWLLGGSEKPRLLTAR